MRINQFIAQATGLSRRAADQAIADQRVRVNDRLAVLGDQIKPADTITLDNQPLEPAAKIQTILLNKPAGYVTSRDGQGSRTIYDLLPTEYHQLKPVGRLDKDSSGLLLLTNDGELANRLTHPRYAKTKVYEVELDQSLKPTDQQAIAKGVQLEDGPSKLHLKGQGTRWQVTMAEGRNRQIRRSFQARGYAVLKLHRKQFGDYQLDPSLAAGDWSIQAEASGRPADS